VTQDLAWEDRIVTISIRVCGWGELRQMLHRKLRARLVWWRPGVGPGGSRAGAVREVRRMIEALIEEEHPLLNTREQAILTTELLVLALPGNSTRELERSQP
jgi:hypothetical protein